MAGFTLPSVAVMLLLPWNMHPGCYLSKAEAEVVGVCRGQGTVSQILGYEAYGVARRKERMRHVVPGRMWMTVWTVNVGRATDFVEDVTELADRARQHPRVG